MPQWPFSNRAGRGSDSLSFPVRVAGKAVTRAEKTKGTKPIGKIKLTPVTLSLCNWRNLNWISLTERCWHWEIAQTWEALAGQGKRWWGEEKKNEKKLPHLFINVSPYVPLSHFSLSQGDNAPPSNPPSTANLITHCGPLRRPPIFQQCPANTTRRRTVHASPATTRTTLYNESSWTAS